MGLFGLNSANRSNKNNTSFSNPFGKSSNSPTSNKQELAPSPAPQTVRTLVNDTLGLIEQPSVDSLISSADAQIKLTLAHDQALDTLNEAVSTLRTKLDDIKPEKLPGVITATSKVVESIRKERLELSRGNNRNVTINFYTPVQKRLEDYDIIDVG
jgi:hypothetical protein